MIDYSYNGSGDKNAQNERFTPHFELFWNEVFHIYGEIRYLHVTG